MAFLRKEKQKSGTYLSICENYRDARGKVKQQILYKLGKAEAYDPEVLQRIGSQLYLLGKGKLEDLLKTATQEQGRYNYGFPLICKNLLGIYNLEVIFNRIVKKHKLSFDILKVVQLMLCDRLNDPMSKLAVYDFQDEYLGLSKVELHHIYRTLDKLCDYKELIQKQMYQRNINLFNYELDLVFYDVTTFYFDSQVEQPGKLRQMGFGKDGKIGKTQVVFGMLIDRNKNPIAYKVYNGDQYEGYTLADAIKKLKEEYNIKKVIVVADRGMMNSDNLALFDPGAIAADYHYIVGERLKNLTQEAKIYLTDLKNYKTTTVTNSQGEEINLQYCTYKYKERMIIGTYSKTREKKDRYEREKKIEKGKRLLKKPDELKKKAARYFLKNVGKEQYEFDNEKIKNAARFDGFLAIATNQEELSESEVLDKYKDLYKIEHGFRTFKSYLETRPMFHWTDKRIEGHLCMCYLAFCLLNYLQQILKVKKISTSENDIRMMLAKMQVSLITQNENKFYLRSAMDEQTNRMLSALKLKPMPDLVHNTLINRYL